MATDPQKAGGKGNGAGKGDSGISSGDQPTADRSSGGDGNGNINQDGGSGSGESGGSSDGGNGGSSSGGQDNAWT
jgi:hypothetical protein